MKSLKLTRPLREQNRFQIRNIEDLKDWTKLFAKRIGTKCILLLQGDMGVGKTQLVKCLVQTYGARVSATSPTFAIHHSYVLNPEMEIKGVRVEHFDLYRLENEDDLESTGFWDLFLQEKGIIAIEWPENMQLTHLPTDWPIYWIEIHIQGEGTQRTVDVKLF